MNTLLAILVIILTVNETLGVGSIGGYGDIVDELADLNNNLSDMKELLSGSLTSIYGETLNQIGFGSARSSRGHNAMSVRS